jgi:antirestriction protein
MENPRIYVASLSDYNNGRLEGKWFDLSDYSNGSELMDGINEMLEEISEKYNDGEVREEWAVHDYEYIPSSLASEYMGENEFQQIYDIMEASEENNIPFEVLIERVGDVGSDDYGNIAESLVLVVDGNDETDIVFDLEQQMGALDFSFWQNHIYIDDVTERVMYGEDVDNFREEIESENSYMDEDEIERLAEERADEQESRRNDDLIGYLEDNGYSDIPSFVSKDYESAWNDLSMDYDVINYEDKMYVFSNNYGFGGGLLVGSLVGAYLGYKVGKYKKKVISSGFKTEKRIGKGIKNKVQGKKTFVDGGGVGETMHFFVVRDKNDKNYNRVGYSIDETITDYKQGNEFEKLYFENNKLPKKYNVKDLIYLQQRDTFTQKDRFGFESDFVLLVEYESLPFPYYYLYDVNKKIVSGDGGLSWIKTYLPKDFKFNDSYGEGGGVGRERFNLSFNYNPSNVSNEDAEKIVNQYTNDWKHNNDFDNVSFYVFNLTKEKADELKALLKMEDVFNIEIQKSNYVKGGVVFTDYNGSSIMYEPNYEEYFVNDEVFYSMEEAKNYIDNGSGKLKRDTFNVLSELYNLKDEGVTQVQLNGFNESIGYVIGLRLNDTEIEKVGNNAYITLYKKGGNVNTGLSWHLDRAKFNKSEDYEIPLNKRKFVGGGEIKLKIKNVDSFDKHYDEVGFTKKELSLAKQDSNKSWFTTTKDKSIAEQLISDGFVDKFNEGGAIDGISDLIYG